MKHEAGIAFPTKRLKYLVALRRSRNMRREGAQPYIGLEDIESWTGRLVDDGATSGHGTTPSTADEGKSLSNSFESGDVLFGKLRPYLAKAWVAEFPGRCTTEALVMEPQSIEPRFLRGVCLSHAFINAVDASTFGSKMPRAEWDFIGNIPVPIPEWERQSAIAGYLDRETARLDALVAEKEHLLKLLTEKRQALITRAVTRGLDPGASMRDSGIPWLGEIPAHWNLVPLRFLVSFVGGATPDTGKEKYWSGDIPWVPPKDMRHGEIEDSEDHVTELAVSDTSLRMIPPGSVLVVVRGMILAHSFPAAITRVAVTVNQDMKALLCREILDPWFLRDYFRGVEHYLVTLADSSAHGTRKLETERLGQVPILVPPHAEQKQIARYLSDSTSKIDKTRMATERTIAFLKERRAALIAAAVTGQIDVGRAG